jgi:hypothetical protein
MITIYGYGTLNHHLSLPILFVLLSPFLCFLSSTLSFSSLSLSLSLSLFLSLSVTNTPSHLHSLPHSLSPPFSPPPPSLSPSSSSLLHYSSFPSFPIFSYKKSAVHPYRHSLVLSFQYRGRKQSKLLHTRTRRTYTK